MTGGKFLSWIRLLEQRLAFLTVGDGLFTMLHQQRFRGMVIQMAFLSQTDRMFI
jgi:hypothetical protein